MVNFSHNFVPASPLSSDTTIRVLRLLLNDSKINDRKHFQITFDLKGENMNMYHVWLALKVSGRAPNAGEQSCVNVTLGW